RLRAHVDLAQRSNMSAVFPPLVASLTLVDLLLLLAPALIVPLGLRLLPFQGPRARQLLRAARILQPIGAAMAIVSFLFAPGALAGTIALDWPISCGVTALAGVIGVIERRERGRRGALSPTGALLVVSSVPITAAGITTGSGLLTVLGPVLLAAGVLGIAGLTALAMAPAIESVIGRWMLWLTAAVVV